jgi:ATP-dependent DNA ligase
MGELVEVFPEDSIVDGELVALGVDAAGRVGQDFNRVGATVFGGGEDRLSFVIFEAVRLAGRDLRREPWHVRRARLEDVSCPPGLAVSTIEVFPAEEAVHLELVGLGFEGSVLKHRGGHYHAGWRSPGWRKVKTRAMSRAVIEVVAADRVSGVVERVGCRAAADPDRLTWACVWPGPLRHDLTSEPRRALGRCAEVAFTHRTITGALREARLTRLD